MGMLYGHNLEDMTTHNGQVVSFDSFWQIRVVWAHNEGNNNSEREIGENKEERKSNKRVGMRMPGVEPGMSPSQGEVLTTILHTPGEAGCRSQYLSHAKRALYHLSYIPFENHKPPHFRSHSCSVQ